MKVRLKADKVKENLARINQPRKWLIAEVGTDSGYMSQLMRGIRHPSPEKRKKIMKALNVSDFDELFEIVKTDQCPSKAT